MEGRPRPKLKYKFAPLSVPFVGKYLCAVAYQTEEFCEEKYMQYLNEYLEITERLGLKSLIESDEEIPTIDITSDSEELSTTTKKDDCDTDEGCKAHENLYENTLDDHESSNLQSAVDDISAAIVEKLQAEKLLPNSILESLQQCTPAQLKKVFLSLRNLSSNNVSIFGNYIMEGCTDDTIITNYIRLLLFHKVKVEYSVELQINLYDLFEKFNEILINEFSKVIVDYEDTGTAHRYVLSQYIIHMPDEFKTLLLENIIKNIDILREFHLMIILSLIEKQVNHETLKQIIKIMSKNVDSFSTNKTFGKLLFIITRELRSDESTIELPLKYIIARHNSIWKSKILGEREENFEEIILLTRRLLLGRD